MRAELIRRRDLELAGLGGEEGMAMPLRELADLHLADLATRVTPHHLRNVRCILDRALEAIEAVRVRDLRPHDLLVYRQGLVAEGRSHRWANLAVDRVRAMLAWGGKVGLIAQSPVRDLDRLPEGAKHTRCRRRALSEDEIRAFLAAAAEDDRRCAEVQASARRSRRQGRGLRLVDAPAPPRIPQLPFWRTLVDLGPRYGETVAACWGDLDVDAATLVLRAENTKSGKERLLPVPGPLLAELVALRRVHEAVLGRPVGASDRLFLTPEGCPWPKPSNNVNRIFRRILKAAGIERVDERGEKLDVHALRGTAASRLARTGTPVAVTQRLLGHADARTTLKHYVHVGMDEMRAAVDRLPNDRDKARKVGA
jgi:integrase